MMYAISYKIKNRPAHDEEFEYEREMRNHAFIWLDDEEIEYVHYYYGNKEYFPAWT